MAAKLDLKGQWVLLTGASSGLGADMAKQLAREYQANLVLVARREKNLIELKAQLQAEFDIQCEVLATDLSVESQVEQLYLNAIEGREIKAVILNAGLTYFGYDSELDWQYFKTMLDTNVSSVVMLSQRFLNYFDVKQSNGVVLVVGSMAGLVPVPYQAAYSGSKAFLSHYVQAVSQEIRLKPYSFCYFAPGGIETEMTETSGLSEYFGGSFLLQGVESCARDGIDTMLGRRYLFVPRFINKIQVFLTRLIPRKIATLTTAQTYEKAINS